MFSMTCSHWGNRSKVNELSLKFDENVRNRALHYFDFSGHVRRRRRPNRLRGSQIALVIYCNNVCRNLSIPKRIKKKKKG